MTLSAMSTAENERWITFRIRWISQAGRHRESPRAVYPGISARFNPRHNSVVAADQALLPAQDSMKCERCGDVFWSTDGYPPAHSSQEEVFFQ
jgi:hypothetical protein